MNNPNELVLVEDFLLAVPYSQEDVPAIVQTSVEIDLTEFKLTEQELYKLKKIIKKLNFHLSDAFSKVCPAASVITEIQPKSTITPELAKQTYS